MIQTGYDMLSCILRLLLACVCGGIIGLERTKRLKEAGIRTHCIIATASSLVMMISMFGFSEVTNVAGIKEADPSRIAANITTGISFLCAGVIFKNGSSVKGLTTAAGIWATAVVGMAIGCGMYIPGIALTALVMLIQLVFHRYSLGNDAYAESDIVIKATGTDEFRRRLLSDIGSRNIQLLSLHTQRQGDSVEYTVSCRSKKDYTSDDIEKLMEEFPEISSVNIVY